MGAFGPHINVESVMLTIVSKPESIATLEQFVQATLKKYGFLEEKYPLILISLTEAVNNAIVHGNDMDEQKVVTISHSVSGDLLTFRIRDEGKGFDPAKIPDPTNMDNIDKCGGRGVLIMRNLADNLNYRENGCCLEISFRV